MLWYYRAGVLEKFVAIAQTCERHNGWELSEVAKALGANVERKAYDSLLKEAKSSRMSEDWAVLSIISAVFDSVAEEQGECVELQQLEELFELVEYESGIKFDPQ